MKLYEGNSAAQQRMSCYTLSLITNGVDVYYLAFENNGISILRASVDEKKLLVFNLIDSKQFDGLNLFKKIKVLDEFITKLTDSVFLIYPTTKSLYEFLFFYIIKIKHKIKIYYELNERRKYSVTTQPKKFELLINPKLYIKKKNKIFFSRFYRIII